MPDNNSLLISPLLVFPYDFYLVIALEEAIFLISPRILPILKLSACANRAKELFIISEISAQVQVRLLQNLVTETYHIVINRL